MAYRCFIFDLDGTLLDTSHGILNSLRNTEKTLGIPPLPEEVLRRFIGPPLLKSTMQYYGLAEAEAMGFIDAYRADYLPRLLENAVVYPRVKEILTLLGEHKIHRAVATLKQEAMAHKLLEAYGLLDSFDMIIGLPPERDLSPGTLRTKGAQIAHIVETLGVLPREAVMVGDSIYDGVGAEEAGVDFIAQLYGYCFANVESPGGIPIRFSAATPDGLFDFIEQNI